MNACAPTPAARASLIALLSLLLASGCSSVVKQSYRETSPGPGAAPVANPGATQVYASIDPEDDAARLAKDGYARIGVSSFKTSGHVTLDELQAQAREVGADIVLFSVTRPGSRRAVHPFVQNNDGTQSGLRPFSHLTGTKMPNPFGAPPPVGGGMSEFNGTVSSSGIPGVSSSDLAAINAPIYEYTASFWRKKPA